MKVESYFKHDLQVWSGFVELNRSLTCCWTGWTRVATVVDQSSARSIWKCKDSQEWQFVKICMHLLQILYWFVCITSLSVAVCIMF